MFIRTTRLFLRPAWGEDAAAVGRMLNDPQFQNDMAGSPLLEAIADADELLAPPVDPRDVRLLIFRRSDGAPRLVGAAGLGQALHRAEFGIWLDKAERRRGFAQEAARALLALAFDGLKIDEVWTPALRQGAAARLIARLGFNRPHADAPSAVIHAGDWGLRTRLAA